MSRRDRPGLSPSLFPFLAVLVCTLGTLILLLALVAQNATDSAQQAALVEPTKPTTEPHGLTAKAVKGMLDEEMFRVTELVSFRDQQTADLENRRDELSHIEEHLESTRDKLKALNDEVVMLTSDAQNTTEIDQQMLSKVREQIESEKESIAKLREEAKSRNPRIVIVPHKGPNGTERRPIYVECHSNGVTILPERCPITIQQLEKSSHSANPLDAALRAIRLHAMKYYGDTAPPYPLLVVRPDGIESYGMARIAMKDWDDQFGYELVPEDIELAFDRPDPNLKQKIDFAIREASSQQQTIQSIAGRGGIGRQSHGEQGRGSAVTGRQGNRRLPTLSAASLDRAGRANGFRSHRDNIIPRTPAGQQNAYQQGSQYGDRPYAAPYGGQPYGLAPGNTDAGDEARQWAAKIRSTTNEMKRGTQNRSNMEDDSPFLAPEKTSDLITSHTKRGDSQQGPDAHSAGRTLSSSSNPIGSGDVAAGSGNLTGSARQPASSEGVLENGRESPLDQGGTQATSQTTRSGTRGNGGAMRSGMQSGQIPPSQTRSGSRSAPANRQGMPPNSVTDASREPLRKEGKNWALPSRMADLQGNAIVRSIRVECHPDHFVLLASGTGGATEVFGFNHGNTEHATMQLAAAIRERISRWGPALPGGRWEPHLEVLVKPNSEVRFHELKGWLRGSGVEVTGRNSP